MQVVKPNSQTLQYQSYVCMYECMYRLNKNEEYWFKMNKLPLQTKQLSPKYNAPRGSNAKQKPSDAVASIHKLWSDILAKRSEIT